MSNAVDIICPCCDGTGKDAYFDLPKCFTCGGIGHIHVEAMGTVEEFRYGKESIPLDEFYEEDQTSKDIWEWVSQKYEGENWWEVHGKIPVLAAIEEILIDAGEIQLSDIPGGPNNPTHPYQVAYAREIEKAMNFVVDQARKDGTGVAEEMSDGYNSYKERLQRVQDSAPEIREKIKRAAEEAQRNLNQETPAVDTAPQTPTIEEDTPMSEHTSVTDRLKTGGRTVLDAAKEGAQLGAVTAANKGAIELLEYKLGDKYPEILKTDAGRTAMQLAIPALMLMIIEMDEGDKIPAKEHVRLAAELAVKGTSADAVEQAMTFLLENGWLILQAYASAGKDIEESHQVEEKFDAEQEMADVRERQEAAQRAKEPVFVRES